MLNLARIARWLAPLAVVAGITAAAAQTTPAPEAGKSDRSIAVATFAGGCFWCVEEAFEKVPGVIRAVSGYTGGTVEKPTYEQVSAKTTGHYEAVQVSFDPTKVSYPQLVDWFWHNIDPVDAKGQFCDQGSPYYTAIFVHSEEQKKVAEESKQALEASGRLKEKIATKILPAGPFPGWPRTTTRTTSQEEPALLSVLQDRPRPRRTARADLGPADRRRTRSSCGFLEVSTLRVRHHDATFF
jgi:methionine-S-sulfoxide reductase